MEAYQNSVTQQQQIEQQQQGKKQPASFGTQQATRANHVGPEEEKVRRQSHAHCRKEQYQYDTSGRIASACCAEVAISRAVVVATKEAVASFAGCQHDNVNGPIRYAHDASKASAATI